MVINVRSRGLVKRFKNGHKNCSNHTCTVGRLKGSTQFRLTLRLLTTSSLEDYMASVKSYNF